jgi:hypothetical protein
MMRTFAFLAATLALATPAFAYPVTVYPVTVMLGPWQYGMVVTQTGPQDFYVNYKANRKPTDYWCAAGYYATQYMHSGNLARVYRASYPPDRVGQGISFTLDPAGSVGVTGLSVFGGKHDGGMNANGAFGEFCIDLDPLDP